MPIDRLASTYIIPRQKQLRLTYKHNQQHCFKHNFYSVTPKFYCSRFHTSEDCASKSKNSGREGRGKSIFQSMETRHKHFGTCRKLKRSLPKMASPSWYFGLTICWCYPYFLRLERTISLYTTVWATSVLCNGN